MGTKTRKTGHYSDLWGPERTLRPLGTWENPGSKGQLDGHSLVGNFLGDPQATCHSLLWSQPASSTSPRKRMVFWLSDIAKGTGG